MENDIPFFYLADSKYGGWVSFSAHLSLITEKNIFKVSPTGRGSGEYGYGVFYKNVTEGLSSVLENKVILAIDKNHRTMLNNFKNSIVVIHDPTEIDDGVLDFLKKSKKVITIRKSVSDFLLKHKIDTEFIPHPFYQYEKSEVKRIGNAVALSRIDFDKGTHTIVEANNIGANIRIYGSKNPFYYYHKLKDLGFDQYYYGEYKKTFNDSRKLYGGFDKLVDLSVIKNDGGGTQYTFLEADYWNQTIIVHKKWADNPHSIWKENENCYVVSNANELLEAVKKEPLKANILPNSNQHWLDVINHYEQK